MTSIHETAYPRLKKYLSEKELIDKYSLTSNELQFIKKHGKSSVAKLGFAVLFKTFQWLGYFTQINDVPSSIIQHIATKINLLKYVDQINEYDTSSARDYHMKLIRKYFSISPKIEASPSVRQAALLAAKTKENLADIINIIIEQLVKERFELPAFGHLLRSARSARTKANTECYEEINALLDNEAKEMIDRILKQPGANQKSVWQEIKDEPKQPTQNNIKSFIEHIRQLEKFANKIPVFAHIASAKMKQFELEAKALGVAKMNELKPRKRYTLAAILIKSQYAKALDDLAEMFIRFMSKLHQDAENEYSKYYLGFASETDELVSILQKIATAYQISCSAEEKLAAIGGALIPNADTVIEKCNCHLAYADKNYFPFLLKRFAYKRSLFFECLTIFNLKSTSSDVTFENAIRFLLENRTSRKEKLSILKKEIDNAGNETETQLIDLSWVSDKWFKAVTGKNNTKAPIIEIDRKYFELCVFSHLMQELKSGDTCIVDSQAYSDYREQLISWDEYEQQIKDYETISGITAEPDTFVATLREKLLTAAQKADSTFPDNEHVDIVNNEITIKKHKAAVKSDEMDKINRLITERLPVTNILDVIVDVEKWLNLSKRFKPLSGYEPKRDTVKERFIATTFCYGCNLGPTQTERSLNIFDRRQIANFNQFCVTEETIDETIVEVVNMFNRLDLPNYFGDNDSASVDGTKWDIYEQNLLAEYHLRYGGYGGIGYYHVSDKYIALFSRFIPCGVYEAIYVLDGLLENKSDIQPTKIHGDTQSQNTPVFGLSYLLGIDLMPRIRNIKSLTFYRPNKNIKFNHIDNIFGEHIDWDLIETHLPDMLRIALSIKSGKITAATILRRLGTYSRKNKIYFAFRELGRAVRTVFLLNYISDIKMRRMIHAATCKSEEFNAFLQWAMFGNDGIIADNHRHQQSKIIKYNHLVANIVILHNTISMTKVINDLIAEEYAISKEILSQLSPYRTEHINRFGNYILDLMRETSPMMFELLIKEAESQLPHSTIELAKIA